MQNTFYFSSNAFLPTAMLPLWQAQLDMSKVILRQHTALWDILSGGLISAYHDEWEHAAVEATQCFNNLAQHPVITQDHVQQTAATLTQIAETLVSNLAWLPLQNTLGQPARKRFPVTLEGEYQQVTP